MKFLKQRTKIVAGISVAILVLFCGTMLTLAKTGVVKLGMLADETNASVIKIFVETPQGQPFGPVGVSASLNGRVDAAADSGEPATAPDGSQGSVVYLRNLFPFKSYLVLFHLPMCDQTTNLTSGDNNTETPYVYKLTCDNAQNPQQKKYNLTGYVRSTSGAVIANATVTKIGGYSVKTNASGLYTLANIPFTSLEEIVSHEFQFSAPGFAPSEVMNLRRLGVNPEVIDNGTTVGGTSVYLTPSTTTPPTQNDTFTFSGKVVSGSTPIAAATVKIGTSNGALTQTTDAQGNFKFTDYPIIHPNGDASKPSTANLYSIKVTAFGYKDLASSLDKYGLSAIAKGVTYSLNPNISMTMDPDHLYIYGNVKDDSGALLTARMVTGYFGPVSASDISSGIPRQSSSISTSYNYLITLPITNFAAQSGKPISIMTPLTDGYSGTGMVMVTIPNNSQFISADIIFKKVVETIKVTGTVKDPSGKGVDGLLVKILPYNMSTTVFGGHYTIQNVGKQKVSVNIAGIPAGFELQGGNPQTIDLSNETGTYNQDFKLVASAPPVPTTTTLYGTVKDDAGNFIRGFVVGFKDGETVLPFTSSQDHALTDSIAAPHNYALSVPKKILTFCPTIPAGYIMDDISCHNVDFSSAGAVFELSFILKSKNSGSITIIGNVKDGSNGNLLGGEPVRAYSLDKSNTSVTMTSATSAAAAIRDDIVSPHNFRIDNVLRSPDGKYVIFFPDKPNKVGRRAPNSGFEGQLLTISSSVARGNSASKSSGNSLIPLGNNVFKINDVSLKFDNSYTSWNAYLAKNLFNQKKWDYNFLIAKFGK